MIMKKILYAVFSLLVCSNLVNAQSVGISSPYTAPDVSARLDVNATNKGLLIPRVALTSLTDKVTIAAPATSLLVYNTNAALGVGYYYNSGSTTTAAWVKVLTTATGWSLTGNAGTSPATNFVGTTNNIPLRFRSNNGVVGHFSQDNIFLGDSAGIATNEALGYYNVAVGSLAFNSNDTGANNVAIGAGALISATSDFESVGVGFLALASNDDPYAIGNVNVAVGSNAGYSNYDGYYNTAVGGYSMYSNVSGVGNTAIGLGADCYDTLNGLDVNNAMALGFNAIALNDNEVRIGNDDVTTIGGAVDWSVLSDGRYKKDIKADNGGLGFIMQLRPVNYHYNYQMMNNERIRQLTIAKNRATKLGHFAQANQTGLLLKRLSSQQAKQRASLSERPVYNGLIAQEVEAAANKIGYNFSGVVKPNKPNGKYALRYATFVVPLIEAVQQQQQIIEDQNKKIDALIKRVEALENK
jgi:trimeric autotransporter adhesin